MWPRMGQETCGQGREGGHVVKTGLGHLLEKARTGSGIGIDGGPYGQGRG